MVNVLRRHSSPADRRAASRIERRCTNGIRGVSMQIAHLEDYIMSLKDTFDENAKMLPDDQRESAWAAFITSERLLALLKVQKVLRRIYPRHDFPPPEVRRGTL